MKEKFTRKFDWICDKIATGIAGFREPTIINIDEGVAGVKKPKVLHLSGGFPDQGFIDVTMKAVPTLFTPSEWAALKEISGQGTYVLKPIAGVFWRPLFHALYKVIGQEESIYWNCSDSQRSATIQ